MKQAILILLLLVSIQPLAEAQLIKTSLTLTVRDELGNTIEGASVVIYDSESDFNAEKNPAAQAITDNKGIVKFKELKAISYFVIVRKGDKDNLGAGEQIGKLEANKFNKATVIIQ